MQEFNNRPGLAKSEQNQEETIDIKSIVFKFLNAWPLFALSLIVGLFIAFLINRYTKKEYNVESVILVDQDKKGGGMESIMTAIGYYNPRLTFENELVILQSYGLTERVIKSLDFEVSYFSEGRLKSIELYETSPLKVEFDAEHVQVVKGAFTLVATGGDKFELFLPEKGELYNYALGKNVEIRNYEASKAELPISVDYDQWIETDDYKFRIVQISPNFTAADNRRIKFIFNSYKNLVEKYNGALKVEPTAEGSSAIDLMMSGPTPEKFRDYLNAFNREYIALGLETKTQIAENTLRFINKELAQIEDSLQRVEGILQTFRSENKIIDLSEEGKEVYNQLFELENQYSQQVTKNKYYEYLYRYLQEDRAMDAIVAPSSMGVQDPLLVQLIANLSELYVKINSLGVGITDKNPRVREIKSQIESQRKVLKENLKNIMENSDILVKDLQERIKKLEKSMAGFPKTERELINIRRKFQLNEDLYVFLMEKRAETGIAKASTLPDNRVIDEARIVDIPVKPKKGMNYAIAFVLALAFPAGYILLRDFFYTKIKSKDEVEQITSMPIAALVGHNAKDTNTVVLDFPKSSLAESFRSMESKS